MGHKVCILRDTLVRRGAVGVFPAVEFYLQRARGSACRGPGSACVCFSAVLAGATRTAGAARARAAGAGVVGVGIWTGGRRLVSNDLGDLHRSAAGAKTVKNGVVVVAKAAGGNGSARTSISTGGCRR